MSGHESSARPQVACGGLVSTWLATLALFALAPSAPASWTAYDDHTPGPETGANVAAYNLRTAGGGPLSDQASGVLLPAGLQVTPARNPIAVRYGAEPATNTPAWQVFNGYVDFFTSNSADNGSLLYAVSNQSITLTFTNLDPAKDYSFRGASIRGGADDGTAANNFRRRWTLCSLQGAASYTDAHSTGCVTVVTLPESSLAPGQAAYNSGMNRNNGDVVGWDKIRPGADGSFSILQTQYQGPIWNGDQASATNEPAYAINGFRLEETTPGLVFGLVSPAENASFTLPTQIAITAAAAGAQTPITNVVFYANATELGSALSAPWGWVWTNPPPGSYQLSAVAWESNANATTSAVVNIMVTQSAGHYGNVYLVVGSDTAIWNDGSTVNINAHHPSYSLDSFTDPASPSFQVMDPVWRAQFTDSAGQPVKFTWWLMGGNIYREATNLNVPVPNTMIPYLMRKYHGDSIRFFGDEVSLHYHTFIWSDYAGAGDYYWNQAQAFADCRQDFDYTLAQYLLEEGIFPVSFRSGWHYMDNDWQAYLNQLLPFSLDDDWPADVAWPANQPVANVRDWSRAPSAFAPFRPATNDYQVPGTGAGWNVRSIKMQNMAQSDVNAIFKKAAQGVDQVVCIWDHLPEGFVTNFARIDSYARLAASSYSGVPFYYCTAVEAMQRWLGATNLAPPEIALSESVQQDAVTLTIQTSKSLFQPQPFVAVRDASAQYSNVTALCVAGPATDSWVVTLPVPRSQLAKVGIAVTDPSGNLATRILRYLPDVQYLDDLDPQYTETQGDWLSTPEAAWGTDARVARLGPPDTVQARWTLPISRSGPYSLAVQVPPITNAASNVWFTVSSGGSNVSTVFFPAPLPTAQWVDLGSCALDATHTNWVDMTVSGTNQPGAWVVADVLRVVPLADPNTHAQSSLTGTMTQNGFVVRFAGTPGLWAQVERSADLSSWTTLATMAIPAQGFVEFGETDPPPMGAFYQVKTR